MISFREHRQKHLSKTGAKLRMNGLLPYSPLQTPFMMFAETAELGGTFATLEQALSQYRWAELFLLFVLLKSPTTIPSFLLQKRKPIHTTRSKWLRPP